MRTFKEYVGPVESLQEHLINSTKQQTDFLVDAIYSNYIKEFDKSQPQCVGWLDGEENGLLRNQLIYEAGIENDDSVLDIGCGVAHFYHFLKMEGWDGKYLGIDPNKAAIDVVEESINTKCGTGKYRFNKLGYQNGGLLMEFTLIHDTSFKDTDTIYHRLGDYCYLTLSQFLYAYKHYVSA